jgi:hypothetical protein
MSEPFDEQDRLLTFPGGAVKSAGERVSGRVITYSGARDPDRAREYFDNLTDFWMSGGERRPILYRHGADPVLGKRRFGEVQLTRAADGVWCDGFVNGRDHDSVKMLEMAAGSLLNWSTGSAGHLVELEAVGESKHITSWPIIEVSLCPAATVAEPRNILSLKSFVFDGTPNFDEIDVQSKQDFYNERAEAAWQHFCDLRARFELQRRGIYV